MARFFNDLITLRLIIDQLHLGLFAIRSWNKIDWVMKDWLLKLKVRWKLLIAFSSILVLSVVLTVVVISSTRAILNYNQLNEKMDRVNVTVLVMNGLVKDFYSQGYKNEQFQVSGRSKLVDEFEIVFAEQDSLLKRISGYELFEESRHQKELGQLEEVHYEYKEGFYNLVSLFKERGFKDHGVEGELRNSIHEVEDAPYEYDKALMLMLRRHEKDFFLRKDEKYLQRFNGSTAVFRQAILASDSSQTAGAKRILANLDNYQEKFNLVVELEKEIGLNTASGAVGMINEKYTIISDRLASLTQLVKEERGMLVQSSFIKVFSLLAVQVAGGLILILIYSNALTKAVKEIQTAMVSLSNGAYPETLITRAKDEIGQTKTALNHLVERIKEAASFARSLGEGNLDTKYNERFKDDVLAKSIIHMQHKLIDINQKQETTHWMNKGLATFSDLLKEDINNLGELSDSIISQSVRYLGANQGAIYVLDHEKDQLQRAATYAYGKKKYFEDTVKVGEGLVGQCVLEADTIYLTDVPSDYVKITSGLGEATPRNVLIVPLKSKDTIVGVLELAAFGMFQPHQISFVEKVSENVANILSSRMVSQKTEKLLEESQAKAEILAAQEEELRQNTEELQATQEQMHRNEAEFKKRIKDLEQQLFHLEQQLLHKEKQILVFKAARSRVTA